MSPAGEHVKGGVTGVSKATNAIRSGALGPEDEPPGLAPCGSLATVPGCLSQWGAARLQTVWGQEERWGASEAP